MLSGTLTVIVQAAQSSLSLSSPSAIWVRGQSSSVQVPVMVTNGGNVAFSSVSLSANPASVAGASVSFSSNGFSLAAGETKNVTATITGVSASPATYVIPLTATTSSTTTNGGITLQVRDPITQFSVSGQLDLGSSGAQRGTTVSGVIHVQNTGDGVIASINVTNTFASKYNAQVSPQIIGNLQPGQGVDVSVTMTIPSDQGASRTQVGTIVFNDGQSQKSVSVTMQAESMLRIDDINVVYNGVSKDVNNGDTRRVELVGGEKLDLEVKVKNEFTSDIDIQDVTVSGIIYNIDDGDDIDDESSSFDLRYDRSSTRTISFDIPDKLDSDNYDVEVTVTGRDDNGVRHSDTWKFQLEINKKNLDVRIVSASLNPSQVSCGASGSAYARLSNYGNNDQENIILEIKNAQLGLNALSESKLYTDEDYDKTVSFLVPQGIANGIYTVTVSVYQKYVNLGSLLDQQQLSLSVVNCAGSGSNGGSGNTGGSTGGNTGGNTGSNTGGTTIIVPPITQPDVIYGNGQPAYGTTRRSFLSGDAYLAILALAIAVLVGVLAWMLGQMRK
ncbi:hypothetical protein COY28_03880 [Candidatus Woesearchaeota archaeon CG_4_10_14_0_2_um_filter_57_5]|nr:MAG: hypothetical protein COY28_03880 [Candidatus Woesearchaeota archaeon CG_4_10_14_0_2_um_filter_57_5]